MFVRYFLFPVVFFISSSVMAEEYTCPDSIEVRQALVMVSDGWEGMYQSATGDFKPLDGNNNKEVTEKIKLTDVALYAGSPADSTLLSPDNEDELMEKDADAVWTLSSVEEQQKNPVYVVCGYAGSAINTFKKTTAPVKSCKWSYSADSMNGTVDCVPY